MPQTTLALLALACATLFSVKRDQEIAEGHRTLVRNEVSMLATSVATDQIETISAKAFDEATFGDRRTTSSSQLTPTASFGKGNDAGDYNDVDDYHLSIDTVARRAGSGTLLFRVSTRVAYAEPNALFTEAAGVTKVKKATAYVESITVPLGSQTVLAQSFVCGSACTW